MVASRDGKLGRAYRYSEPNEVGTLLGLLGVDADDIAEAKLAQVLGIAVYIKNVELSPEQLDWFDDSPPSSHE
jgi:hypothetical protein